MEEHATFSLDSKTISGITEIVDNCLTVFQYGVEVFLYEAKDFRKVRISLLFTTAIVPLNAQPNEGKTSPCVVSLSLPSPTQNIENQMRVDALFHWTMLFAR